MANCNCAERERHDWFPMEAMGFLNSDTVALCQPWETQAFLHMLILAWAGPGISANREVLGARLGLTAERIDELLSGAVGRQWTECCGKLWNAKLEEHRDVSQARRDERRAGASAAGKRSGEVRRQKAEARKAELEAERNRTDLNGIERNRTDPNGGEQVPTDRTTGQDRTGQETTQLPSGASGGRALTHDGSPVPQKNLETAIAKCLEPLPPPVLAELREFAVHVGERTGQSRGESYWRGVIQQLWKKPDRALDRLAFSRAKDAKNLLDPTDDELAKFRGEDGKGRDQFVTGRVAVQRANTESLAAFAANGQRAGSQGGSAPGLDPGRNALEILGMGHLVPEPADVESEDVA